MLGPLTTPKGFDLQRPNLAHGNAGGEDHVSGSQPRAQWGAVSMSPDTLAAPIRFDLEQPIWYCNVIGGLSVLHCDQIRCETNFYKFNNHKY